MKKTMKAVFLSIFALPGLGHLYLKHRKTGYFFIIASLSCTALIIQQAIQTANKLINDLIASNDISQIDISKIADLAQQALKESNFLPMQIAFYGLIFCYIFATISAYIIAKKQEGEEDEA